MNNKVKKFENLLEKVEKVAREKKIDLSSGEDLSIGIMNLIGAEEHLFYTFEKTKKTEYLDLLNEVRVLRTELMRDLIKDYEGEVWYIAKHLLSASMRLMEVGTKELKNGNKKKSQELFDKSFKLYSMFWGLALKAADKKDIQQMKDDINFLDEKGNKIGTASVFDKLGNILQKALDCCRE